MEIYYVKDKRKAPNVAGSEREVLTKNGRRLLKAKCAVCGKTKAPLLPSKKMTGEGSGGALSFPLVDFKKLLDVVSNPNLFKGPSVSPEEARRVLRGYKRDCTKYERYGGTRSYGSWIKWKGYGCGLTGVGGFRHLWEFVTATDDDNMPWNEENTLLKRKFQRQFAS